MNSPAPRGIVESISDGFALVARRPYLIAVPVLVDALLWVAKGISARPLLASTLDPLLDGVVQGPVSPGNIVQLNQQMVAMEEVLGSLNILAIVAWQIPNLLGLGATEGSQSPALVGSWFTLLLLLLSLAGLAALVGCLFMGPLGLFVRYNTLNLSVFLRLLAKLWYRFALYLGIIVLLGVVLAFLMLIVVSLFSLGGPGGVALGVGLTAGLLLMVLVHLFLAEEAIFVAGVGPVEAIKESFNIVHRNFWSVLGIFLLVNVIVQGTSIIWGFFPSNSLGLVIGVLGNAFIGTGLAAAIMVYYWSKRQQLAPGAPAHDQTSNGDRSDE